ncbi:MAG: beta-galactosidase [Terriglobales bacterium]
MKILQAALFATTCLLVAPALAANSREDSPTKESMVSSVVVIDARQQKSAPETGYLHAGGVSKAGHSIAINSRYLSRDGKPWLPVMGEFHFARYPEAYWEEEILKMKAGGVQIVSTYVFWIHHEEIEGQFDWTGQRNLRRFVELCRKHGMLVFVRIGPWDHGEVRNGGLPDWLLRKAKVRTNDPIYLSHVRRLYGEIGKQLQGLFWNDDGPIIGVQLENEYGERGPNAGAAHISALKRLALESGIDAPLFTVTGWPKADFPAPEVIPVFGAYPDGFWEELPGEAPPHEAYLFELKRDTDDMSADLIRYEHYPYLLAEAGGGMEMSYHRRPLIRPADVAAMDVTHVGSGANLYGYYMFHGGANPEGRLTTLQESHATGYPNDVPQVTYDFQAPLGEYGQMHPSFRNLKLLHQFYSDFGAELAPMTAFLPEQLPASPADSATLRSAVRTDGDGGFVFLNNYVHNLPMPDKKGITFQIRLPKETVALPRNPVDIPSGAYSVWPFNLSLGSARLLYSTAELLSKLELEDSSYYVFFAVPGVAPEFAFDETSVGKIVAEGGTLVREHGRLYVDGLKPGTNEAISIQTVSGKSVHLLLLSQEQAQSLWKIEINGKHYLALTDADVFFDESTLHLRSRDPSKLAFSILPPLSRDPKANAPLRSVGSDGVFASYAAEVAPREFDIRWEQTQPAGPREPVHTSSLQRKGPVAVVPEEAEFKDAGTWKITPPSLGGTGVSDVFLRIDYRGDIGRLYAGQRLLDDDFYHGETWEVGWKRFTSLGGSDITLKVLPLRKDAPIYLSPGARPDFGSGQQICTVRSIGASTEYEVQVTF